MQGTDKPRGKQKTKRMIEDISGFSGHERLLSVRDCRSDHGYFFYGKKSKTDLDTFVFHEHLSGIIGFAGI